MTRVVGGGLTLAFQPMTVHLSRSSLTWSVISLILELMDHYGCPVQLGMIVYNFESIGFHWCIDTLHHL